MIGVEFIGATIGVTAMGANESAEEDGEEEGIVA
jgi:hypothetical protein